MDCPHVSLCPISTKIPLIISSLTSPPHLLAACQVCSSVQSPWLCLQCGSIHCGRYIHGHAKMHYDENKQTKSSSTTSSTSHKNSTIHQHSELSSAQHCVSVDIYSGAAFCYSCDEFISNVPKKVAQEIRELIDEENDSENNNEPHQPSTKSPKPPASQTTSKIRKRRSGSNSSTSTNNTIVTNGDVNSEIDDLKSCGMNVESKKRKLNGTVTVTSSTVTPTTSDSPKNHQVLVGGSSSPHRFANSRTSLAATAGPVASANPTTPTLGIGLRNLGNTCFMNAVLQSLSKLSPFSTYISTIPHPKPSLEPETPQNLQKTTLTFSNPVSYSTRSRQRISDGTAQRRISNGIDSDSKDSMDSFGSDLVLTMELKRVIGMLSNGAIPVSPFSSLTSTPVSPDSLFSIIWDVMPRFRGYQQQDAHEFLRYMLDHLHSELVHLILPKKSTNSIEPELSPSKNGQRNGHAVPKNSSIVTELFGGILENEVTCTTCSGISHKLDPFLDLSLDIPDSKQIITDNSNTTTLNNCLSSFTSVEYLTDDDKYYCGKCKLHTRSMKRMKIEKLPEVLCLHLKRFRWSHYTRSKLDNYVKFPLVGLDMGEYLKISNSQRQRRRSVNTGSKYLYDLSAVIVHHGTGVGSGHYTAYAKSQQDNPQWFHFNDSNVKVIGENELEKCKAYILFYTRRK